MGGTDCRDHDGAESGRGEIIKIISTRQHVLLAVMSMVVAFFVLLAVRYLWHGQGWAGLFSTEPFYNPKTFNSLKILTATSFAALAYIGFGRGDYSAEDVENPKRNVLLAVVLTCIFAGVSNALEAYLGARVWPDWRSFPDLVTAFMDVCRRVGSLSLAKMLSGSNAFEISDIQEVETAC